MSEIFIENHYKKMSQRTTAFLVKGNNEETEEEESCFLCSVFPLYWFPCSRPNEETKSKGKK